MYSVGSRNNKEVCIGRDDNDCVVIDIDDRYAVLDVNQAVKICSIIHSIITEIVEANEPAIEQKIELNESNDGFDESKVSFEVVRMGERTGILAKYIVGNDIFDCSFDIQDTWTWDIVKGAMKSAVDELKRASGHN